MSRPRTESSLRAQDSVAGLETACPRNLLRWPCGEMSHFPGAPADWRPGHLRLTCDAPACSCEGPGLGRREAEGLPSST